MSCYRPVKGYRHPDGTVKFAAHGGVHRPVEVSCGNCIGCRLKRSCDWAIRCVNESQLHEFSSFVTLTYDDEKWYRTSLVYRDFQLFMKRVRFKFGPVRFYMCGEYGDRTLRPHFHALLFGLFFPDRKYYGKSGSGFPLWTSETLSKLWPHGFSWIGDVSFESAAYVARYCMKKVNGRDSKEHYHALGVMAGNVDYHSGEILPLEPEFTSMSLKPGIGADWYAKFGKEVRFRDGVVIEGDVRRTPRYYDTLLKRMDAVDFEYVSFKRGEEADKHFEDNSPARLLVREAVAKARLSLKKRSLE